MKLKDASDPCDYFFIHISSHLYLWSPAWQVLSKYKKTHSVTVTACVKAVIPFRVSCQLTSASSLRGLTWFCPLLHPWILPLHPRLFTSFASTSSSSFPTYNACIASYCYSYSHTSVTSPLGLRRDRFFSFTLYSFPWVEFTPLNCPLMKVIHDSLGVAVSTTQTIVSFTHTHTQGLLWVFSFIPFPYSIRKRKRRRKRITGVFNRLTVT